MTTHEQFADDLALHALGVLEGAELAALQQHLSSCADCSRELEQLRGDSALLALSVTGAMPPQKAKLRLLDAIHAEGQGVSHIATVKQEFTAPILPLGGRSSDNRVGGQRNSQRTSWFGSLGWLAAAAMLIFSAVQWTENSDLHGKLETARDQAAQQDIRVTKAEQLVSVLTAPDAVRSTLVSAKEKPQPLGKAFYRRDSGNLVFFASNMPALPPNKAFELWLIPENGAPMNAGVFKTDARGNGTLISTNLPLGIAAKAFAITVEDAAGASAPTTPIMILGAARI